MNNYTKILKLSGLFIKQCHSFEKLDKDYLNNLPSARDKEIYLSSLFPHSSMGGSRITYIISPKKAIKLALGDDYDTKQNYNEALSLSRLESMWLPRLYDTAPDYSWIEVELVRPLSNSSEIFELTGIPSEDFLFLMEKGSVNRILKTLTTEFQNIKSWDSEKESDQAKKEISKWMHYKDDPTIKSLMHVIQTLGLDPWEFSLISNLGKSASGHLVLLDTGKVVY